MPVHWLSRSILQSLKILYAKHNSFHFLSQVYGTRLEALKTVDTMCEEQKKLDPWADCR